MSERGAVSLVALTGTLVLCLFALGAADLGSMLLARSRAQAAADAAALAAVVAQTAVLGQQADPTERARETAAANAARLDRCTCEPGTVFAEVEVSIAPRLAFVRSWFGRRARATARAEIDPDVLSYRTPE